MPHWETFRKPDVFAVFDTKVCVCVTFSPFGAKTAKGPRALVAGVFFFWLESLGAGSFYFLKEHPGWGSSHQLGVGLYVAVTADCSTTVDIRFAMLF